MAFLLIGLISGFLIGVMYQRSKTEKMADRDIESAIQARVTPGIAALEQELDTALWERDAAMALYEGAKHEK